MPLNIKGIGDINPALYGSADVSFSGGGSPIFSSSKSLLPDDFLSDIFDKDHDGRTDYDVMPGFGDAVPGMPGSPGYDNSGEPYPDLPVDAQIDIHDIKDHVGSSSKDNLEVSSVVDEFLNLYKKTGDSAWIEKYLDTLIERENVASARNYETEMSNTAFQRYAKDIRDAGYNPWILLQNGGSSASTPNVSPAGSSGVSVSSQATSKENTKVDNFGEIMGRLASAIGVAFAIILRASIGH